MYGTVWISESRELIFQIISQQISRWTPSRPSFHWEWTSKVKRSIHIFSPKIALVYSLKSTTWLPYHVRITIFSVHFLRWHPIIKQLRKFFVRIIHFFGAAYHPCANTVGTTSICSLSIAICLMISGWFFWEYEICIYSTICEKSSFFQKNYQFGLNW